MGEGERDETPENDAGTSPPIDNTFTITIDDKKPTPEIEALGMEIAQKMADELNSGQVEIVMQGRLLKFRIREQGSFGSGEADIQRGFLPVLSKIRGILKGTKGSVAVAGHTDNRPINTKRFPSNWELSGQGRQPLQESC